MYSNLNSAKIQGKSITEFPKDLYIPPDAMLVILDLFEGPLDLLLYLIRKNNLDIIEIPVATITNQYIKYIESMQLTNLELVADYLEMAAILTEIKSRMLLPVSPSEDPEADPRAELVKKLQEYEQIKQAATNLDLIVRQDRDYVIVKLTNSDLPNKIAQPEIKFEELLLTLGKLLAKQELNTAHTILQENLSVRDKMTYIINTLVALEQNPDPNISKFFTFSDFYNYIEGRIGIVVTFMAILELAKENLLEIDQIAYSEPIYIRLKK